MDTHTTPTGEDELDRRLRAGLAATAAGLGPLLTAERPWVDDPRGGRGRYAATPVRTRRRVALAGVLVTGMVTALVVIVLQLTGESGRPNPVPPGSPGPGSSTTTTVTASPEPSSPSSSPTSSTPTATATTSAASAS